MPTPVPVSDAALVRYLLGGLDEAESQRLDELSVVDSDFAERLRAIEHDLADAYVRGDLSAGDRELWERRYLASGDGRADLRLAQALVAHERRAGSAHHGVRFTSGLAAAAALLMAVVAGYFSVVHHSTASRSAASIAPAASTPPASAGTARVVALTLSPATRSLSAMPVLHVPAGTDGVRLTLRLEADFDRYDVDVKDLSTNAIVWRAADAAATTADRTTSLVMTVPAATFKAHHYLITVRTARPRAPEIVGTYPVAVVVQ